MTTTRTYKIEVREEHALVALMEDGRDIEWVGLTDAEAALRRVPEWGRRYSLPIDETMREVEAGIRRWA
jgi:hypothetical protein